MIMINDDYSKLTRYIASERYTRNVIEYDHTKSILILEAIGKGFNNNFLLNENDLVSYSQILKYFMADPSFEGDLNRGLLLKGKIGSGKTLAFIIFKKFLQITGIVKYRYSNIPEPGDLKYNIIRCKDVSSLYEDTEPGKGGDNALKHFKHTKEIICFDDLGEEIHKRKLPLYYGNECNVMEEILTARYESFLKYNTITHATTNFIFDSTGTRPFKQLYGERVEDRMKEMFNEITFKGESKRSRI